MRRMQPLSACHALASALAVLTAVAASGAPADDLRAASKKLAEARGFAWVAKSTGRGFTAAEEGVTEKDGYTTVTKRVNQSQYRVVTKGARTVVNLGGEWQTLDEAAKGGPGGPQGEQRAQLVTVIRNSKPPAEATEFLVTHATGLKRVGEAYEGELTEAAVEEMFTHSGVPVEVRDARGTVRFWVEQGFLSRIESQVHAAIKLNGRDILYDRKEVVEIVDIGIAKAAVPDAAKQKLAPASAAE